MPEEILDPGVVSTNADTFYGCVPADKSNTVIIDGGSPSTVVYTIRDASGNPVDLSKFFNENDPGGEDDPNGVFVRFTIADESAVFKHNVQAYVLDAVNGKIQYDIPEQIYDIPCIYHFYTAVANKDKFLSSGKTLYSAPNKGRLLVEWTPFVIHGSKCAMKHRVVPSIEDVRRKLDDWSSKNNLLNQVEYSADDVVNALIWPVREFNETPPRLRRYNYSLADFPYFEQWVLGAASELLRLSVIHYTRNKLLSSHGGITGDEKNRDTQYLQLAMLWTCAKITFAIVR